MAEKKKIATRESCGNALAALGAEHEDIVVLDADLAGATKSGIFKKAFPERHFNIGIAEADMIGVAAGLSGYLVKPMNIAERMITVAGGLLLIIPGTLTDLLGVGLIAVGIVMQLFLHGKKA